MHVRVFLVETMERTCRLSLKRKVVRMFLRITCFNCKNTVFFSFSFPSSLSFTSHFFPLFFLFYL